VKKKSIYVLVKPGKWSKTKSKSITVFNISRDDVVAVVVAADEAAQKQK
jgi:hypothetical protein